MSLDVGFVSQTPSLPGSGGAKGLGETFTPDLSTGTANMSVPIDLPNGPNDIAPKVALTYSSAGTNGPFGTGWTIAFPRILRTTMHGRPRYEDDDVLVLEGSGPLVHMADGTLRPEVETGDWSIIRHGDGFIVTDRAGTRHELGTTPDSRIPGLGGGTWAWLIHTTEDNLGTTVGYTWRSDGPQRYLDAITFGVYTLQFVYEPRPDVLRWGRGGFILETHERCASIELHVADGAGTSLARRWDLGYARPEPNGVSQLVSVQLTGVGGDGTEASSPPVRFGYVEPGRATIRRVDAVDAGCAPPALSPNGRVDLVDWNGNGLPDVIEFGASGNARVWPNRIGEWGRPQGVGTIPSMADGAAQGALIDFDGDGLADAVRVDGPLRSFQPRTETGFGRPVTWTQAPSASPSAPNCRIADLDGDGLPDVAWSNGRALMLATRAETDGWDPTPFVVPARAQGPPTNLDDPHVFVADMTGDGIPDLVRVDGGGVRYWPYLGYGQFAPVVHMKDPPRLPFDTDPTHLFVVDLDGDGCADVVYVAGDIVRWWPNRAGDGFEPAREIDHVPIGDPRAVRFADLFGSGSPALCWSTEIVPGRARWFALDLFGGARCGLLSTIDNSIGLQTAVSYSTSAAESVRDDTEGQPWSTRLPVVLPVVAQVTTNDTPTGIISTTRYRYHDGRFDGVLREFCGFGRVEAWEIGDATAPTLRTTQWFHIGLNNGEEPTTAADRTSQRAIRGRLYKQERSNEADDVIDAVDQSWIVQPGTDPATVIPRLQSVTRSLYEGGTTPASWVVSEQLVWDTEGNVTEAEERGYVAGTAAPTHVLRTHTNYAVDPAGRFRQRPSRIRQEDGAAKLLAETRAEYDHLPWGQVGNEGLVTRRIALALPDDLVASVYGAGAHPAPDFQSLGYTRVTGVAGWWIEQGGYDRTVDAGRIHGQVTGPRGGVSELELDATGCYPIRLADVYGNELTAVFDSRVYQPTSIVRPSGASSEARFDPLARLVALVEPGDTIAEPTVGYAYDTTTLPIAITTTRRTSTGELPIVARQILDGSGRLVEHRTLDESGEIIETATVYSSRGLTACSLLPRRAPDGNFAPPAANLPGYRFFYDEIGRPVRVVRPDGGARTVRYLPGMVEEADEEDNRTDPGAMHAGTMTRRHVDSTGRVVQIDERLGARTLTSRYTFDLKGNVLEHVDAQGMSTRFTYDLTGRTLRVERPERTQVVVIDPASNVVESRTGTDRVVRTFDLADRLVEVRHNDPASAAIATFAYHDRGRPAPPDAGLHTVGGQLVRVDDESGATVMDYDSRGRVAKKTMRRAGFPTLELSMVYRSDDAVTSITYPTDGASLTVTHEYDRRGLLSRIDNVVDKVEYDLGRRRQRVAYANGTTEVLDIDPLTGRPNSSAVSGPAGVLRDVTFAYDLVGNLLSIASSNAAASWTYEYDDLYRLARATGAGGPEHYIYDDAGNILQRSDTGTITYGGGAIPANCVGHANGFDFTYDERGHVSSGPWGTLHIDSEGRLRALDRTGGGREEFTYSAGGALAHRHSVDAGGTTSETWSPDPLVRIEDGQLVVEISDGGRAVARIRGADRSWFHHDHLGSLVLVTDHTGSSLETRAYGPWGDLRATTGGFTPNHAFATGQAQLPDLVLLGARWYAPSLGRFLSPDPIVVDGSDPFAWNAYAYCRCNPTSYIDPTGRGFWQIFAAVVATIAIIVLAVVVSVITWGTGSGGAAAASVAGISAVWAAVLVPTAIGLVVGGVVGGIAAARAGGDAGDVVLGILVGAAVGGWGAFLGSYAGAAVDGALASLGPVASGAISGGVSGAINGAAMGFASGFAGGKNGGLGDVMEKTLVGLIVGAVIGAVVGGVGGIAAPAKSAGDVLTNPDPPPQPTPAPNASGAQAVPESVANPGAVTVKLLPIAGKVLWASAGSTIIRAAGTQIASTIAVDATAGITADWFGDIQQYLKTHVVGPYSFGGSW